MKILITTPAPPRSRYGNRVTALRWARILKELGHQVTISQSFEGGNYHLLIALHARRSHASIKKFHRTHPDRPLIVALSGTDLYRDLARSRRARESLELATRLVVLQPKAFDDLDAHLHEKTRVIYQSVRMPPHAGEKLPRGRLSSAKEFRVCVIGHLRPVKDPFRAAMAVRRIPLSSNIRIVHVGAAMSEAMKTRAMAEMKNNLRYRWLGEKSPSQTRRILMQSDLCVLSSRMEGGANVLSEAIMASVPVLASRIAGSIGILGEDYPGYFPVGDTRELKRLLLRAESDPAFLNLLRARGAAQADLFAPARERNAWAHLLGAL